MARPGSGARVARARFATLDAISAGRAEVILGRGSFVESFPLFGYDLDQYELLFEEKLDLFVRLLEERPVTWSGRTRPALDGLRAYPPTESGSPSPFGPSPSEPFSQDRPASP